VAGRIGTETFWTLPGGHAPCLGKRRAFPIRGGAPLSIPPAWQERSDFFERPIVPEPAHAKRASVAGLLAIRQFDERVGLTPAFAQALDDPRDPNLIDHTLAEMVRSRVPSEGHE
jgi:hypothetical protein